MYPENYGMRYMMNPNQQGYNDINRNIKTDITNIDGHESLLKYYQ